MRAAAVLALLLAVSAGILGCGTGSSQHSGQAAESTPGVPTARGEAYEAQATRRRKAQLKENEALEEAEIKRKVEELERAQAKAAAEHAAHSHKKHSSKSSQHQAAKPQHKKAGKSKAAEGESAAEKAARKQFAEEEAQEVAAYKKRERQESAGH